MSWDIEYAKQYLYNLGMDHIRDGLFAEGGELIYHSKYGIRLTELQFTRILRKVLHWYPEDIDEVVDEVHLKGRKKVIIND